MCAAVKSDFEKLEKKKMKTKSVLGYCNNLISRMKSPNTKSMLKTDAVPIGNHSQNQTEVNGENGNNDNQQSLQHSDSSSLSIVPSITTTQAVPILPMQLVQNNMNQANQNLTVVESQQNFHISNSNGVHLFGNTYFVAGSSSRKNSCNESFDDKGTPKKTRSLIGMHFHYH